MKILLKTGLVIGDIDSHGDGDGCTPPNPVIARSEFEVHREIFKKRKGNVLFNDALNTFY